MTKYMLIRVEDARWLTHAVDGCAGPGPSDNRALVERLSSDEGGDFEAIVAQLKSAEHCAPCAIEGQLAYCANLEMHKIGRRLDRLVERAQPGGRGHRLPTAEEDAPAPQPTEEPYVPGPPQMMAMVAMYAGGLRSRDPIGAAAIDEAVKQVELTLRQGGLWGDEA